VSILPKNPSLRKIPILALNVTTDRRSFLPYFSSLGLTSTLFPGVLWGQID
jgi:hypothetical protein